MQHCKKPETACEMKVREVHQYSSTHPLSYEVLLYTKGRSGWFRLTMSDGTRALFTAPPATEEEARNVIKEFEESALAAA